MIDLEISAADYKLLLEQLAGDYTMRVGVETLDENEDTIGSWTFPDSRVETGQVSVDVSQPITRSLQLTLLDPDREIHFDSDVPSRAAVFANRFLQVTYEVQVPGSSTADGWIPIPVFHGPVSKFKRTPPHVEIDALGKEWLLLAPNVTLRTFNRKKGFRATDALRDLLGAAGEQLLSIPSIDSALRQDLSIHALQDAWPAALKIAASLNRQLFFDGRGRAHLRPHSERPVFRFTDGAGGTVAPGATVEYDPDKVRNVQITRGPKPDKGKEQIRGKAVAPRAHPLSPWSLARNGVPRFIVEEEDLPHVKSQADADAIAERKLRRSLRLAQAVEFDCAALPMLEEEDLGALATADDVVPGFHAQAWSLALNTQSLMHLGSVRDVLRPRGRRKAA